MQTQELMNEPRIKQVLESECKRAGIRWEVLLGRDSNARLMRVRRRTWERLRAHGYSYALIGRLFGRDPSTIFRGLGGAPDAD